MTVCYPAACRLAPPHGEGAAKIETPMMSSPSISLLWRLPQTIMANLIRSAKSGSDWTLNDLDSYHISLNQLDALPFFGLQVG